jgi:hypothetical protein
LKISGCLFSRNKSCTAGQNLYLKETNRLIKRFFPLEKIDHEDKGKVKKKEVGMVFGFI